MKNKTNPIISKLLLCGVLALPATAGAGLDYTTGLDVWLDASDIDGTNNSTLTEGAQVSVWKNKGTTGVNDAVAILTGGGGGTNGILAVGAGNGGQDAVTLSNTRYQFGQEFIDSPNVTMYFVVNRAAASGAQGTLFTDYGDVSNETMTIRTGTDSVTGVRDSAANTTWVDDGQMEAFEKWATLLFRVDATARSVTYGELGNLTTTAMSAAHIATTTYEGTFAGPVTLFGFHDGNNTHDFNGQVSEVLIFDHILDAAAQTEVEAYLLSKAAPKDEIDFRITEITRNNDGSFSFTWNSDPAPGVTYTLLYSADLETPSNNWADPEDNISTGGTSTSFTIPANVLPANSPGLFFRIRKNPD